MKTLQQLGTDLGKLLEEKNAAYGSSFAASGDFLRLLFPRGVPADRYDDALLMVRIFDKQMRIATDKDAFGESPYQDIAGYGILGVQLHQQRKDSTTWPDTASADAATQSKAQPDSAVPLTGQQTTPNENESSAPAPSQQLESSSAPLKVASVPTAMAGVSASAAAPLRRLRSRKRFCAYCGGAMIPFANSHVRSGEFLYCSMSCCDRDAAEVLV
jgi:hypothetical protein